MFILYVTDQPESTSSNKLYSYSEKEPKTITIESQEIKDIEKTLMNRFHLPLAASQKIIIDYSTEQCGELNKDQYEDIMKQLLDVEPSVLHKRILTFDSADKNQDGYIDLGELPNLFSLIDQEIQKTNGTTVLHYVYNIINNFNKNGNAKFNFLDVNKYMTSFKWT